MEGGQGGFDNKQKPKVGDKMRVFANRLLGRTGTDTKEEQIREAYDRNIRDGRIREVTTRDGELELVPGPNYDTPETSAKREAALTKWQNELNQAYKPRPVSVDPEPTRVINLNALRNAENSPSPDNPVK